MDCAICTDAIEDPRALPCGHSFCGPPKTCLQTMGKSADLITCALCGTSHKLLISSLNPLYGIKDCLANHQKLQEELEKTKAENRSLRKQLLFKPPKCTRSSFFCGSVSFWCNDCKDSFCDDCMIVYHNRHSVCAFRRHLRNLVREKIDGKSKSQLDAFVITGEEVTSALSSRIEHLKDELNSCQSNLQQVQESVEANKTISSLYVEISNFAKGTGECSYADIQYFLAYFMTPKLPKIADNLESIALTRVVKPTLTKREIKKVPLSAEPITFSETFAGVKNKAMGERIYWSDEKSFRDQTFWIGYSLKLSNSSVSASKAIHVYIYKKHAESWEALPIFKITTKIVNHSSKPKLNQIAVVEMQKQSTIEVVKVLWSYLMDKSPNKKKETNEYFNRHDELVISCKLELIN